MTAFDISPAGALSAGLIVNADDLAIHPDSNSGILSAYRERTVRDFVRPALLPIGIHLSLTLGKAAAPGDQVPGLVDEQGNLKLSADRLLLSSFKGRSEERRVGK